MALTNWLDNTFPLREEGNIRRFYLLTAFNNMWFLSGNWIFYWLVFMNYKQLGVMDATCFLFGLVMEVPSGAVADIIGKRKTVVAGMLLAALGFLFMGLANDMVPLWVGFLMAQAGWAFYSGSAEALAYDTLVDSKKESGFDKVISANGSIAIITTVVATLAGGIMYVLYWRSTHLGMAVAYFLAFLIAIGLKEPKTDTEKFSLPVWWNSIVVGSKQLLLPTLKPFVIVMLVLMGTEYIYEWGFVKPAIATSFGFMDREQAVIFASFGIISAFLIKFVPNIRKRINDKIGLYWLTVLMGIGFIIASWPLGYLGILPMLIISISGSLVYPWISIVVNREVEAKHRATALSTVALITKIPYVLIAIVAGNLIQNGDLWKFNLLIGSTVILLMFANLVIGKMRK